MTQTASSEVTGLGRPAQSVLAAASEPPPAGGGERVEIKNAALAGWVRNSLC